MGNNKSQNPSKDLIPKKLQKLKLLFSKLNKGSLNVSEKLPLKFFADEFIDPSIKSKIAELEPTIPYYRRIRGDGNCFYRSIYFQLMEFHFKQNSNNPFIYNLLFSKTDVDLAKFSFEDKKIARKLKENDILYEILKALQEKLFDDPGTILDQLFSEEYLFDFVSIIFVRNLIFAKLQKSLKDPAFAPFITFPDSIQRKLLSYGIEAEDIIIPLTCSTLDIRLVVHMLHLHVSHEGEQKVTLLKEEYFPFEIQSEEEKMKLPVFHLFFRPGHYDIAYTN